MRSWSFVDISAKNRVFCGLALGHDNWFKTDYLNLVEWFGEL
jgi:hypothetical protein